MLAERLAVPAGFVVALAALMPAALASAPGERPAAWLALAAVLLWWLAVVATVRSDLRDFIIPDEATLVTAALGLAVAGGGPLLSGEGAGAAGDALLAAAATGTVAFAVFWLIGAGFRRLGRDALGFGDVKLAGAAALWLGPGDAALALEVAALGALAMLLGARRAGPLRATPVPFGAFLAPSAWLVFVLAPLLRGETGPW